MSAGACRRAGGIVPGLVLAVRDGEALVELRSGDLERVALDVVPDSEEGDVVLCLGGLVLERVAHARDRGPHLIHAGD
jgi:hydrogenase maturation factor